MNEHIKNRILHPEQSPAEKTCQQCTKNKPREEFGSRPTNRDSRDHVCRKCRNEINAAATRKKREEARRDNPYFI
jgi:hypothetical protein